MKALRCELIKVGKFLRQLTANRLLGNSADSLAELRFSFLLLKEYLFFYVFECLSDHSFGIVPQAQGLISEIGWYFVLLRELEHFVLLCCDHLNAVTLCAFQILAKLRAQELERGYGLA